MAHFMRLTLPIRIFLYMLSIGALPFRWKVFFNSSQKWAFSCSIWTPCFLVYLHCGILRIKTLLLKIFPLKLSVGLPSPSLGNTWLFFSALSLHHNNWILINWLLSSLLCVHLFTTVRRLLETKIRHQILGQPQNT